MGLIQFHLDEHIPPGIAAGLRRRGLDVTTTIEVGLERASDEVQLAHAFTEARVFLTRDQDFLALNAAGVSHAGIVFWHSKRKSQGRLIQYLTILCRTTAAEEMVGRVQFV